MDRKPSLRLFTLALALATLLASAALFGALYRWDNKYAHSAPQAKDGVLTLTDQELRAFPVRYLTYGWEFYPGSWLTPAQLKSGSFEPQFVYIGQYQGMQSNAPSQSPHGSATYRLTIRLPDEASEYALDVPEVFSSYRLYLNGVLTESMGDPDPSSYRPEIQNRIVTVHAGGSLEIVLLATDHSAIYNGMVYPPSFGYLQPVLRARDARLVLHSLIVTIALVGALFALYIGKQSKQRSGLFSGLLYLCLIGITSYPLLHTFFATAYFPVYPAEIICYHVMLLLMVALQNKLYDIRGAKALCALLPCIAGVAASAVYSTCAAFLTTGEMSGFSTLIDIVKYYTAAYLLVTSAYAIIRQKRRSSFIFCAGLMFACALLFDRLFPLYEPIVGGWFTEIGGFALVIAFECVLWFELADAYRFRVVFESKQQQMEYRLALQKDHYLQLSGQVKQARIASHDLRHHMRMLRALANKGNLKPIADYLDRYEANIKGHEVATFTSHPTADAVLSYFASQANSKQIDYDVQLKLPEQFDFPDDALCILLSNLLENAMNAASAQTAGKRFIYLRGDIVDHAFRLVIDNSFDGMFPKTNIAPSQNKRDGSGIGMRSIQTLVERHNGVYSFHADKTVFRVSIIIPYPPK